jgi:hypothetical protein
VGGIEGTHVAQHVFIFTSGLGCFLTTTAAAAVFVIRQP